MSTHYIHMERLIIALKAVYHIIYTQQKNNATMRNHLLAPNLEQRASDEAVAKRALEMDEAVFYKSFTLNTKWSSAARFYPSEHVSFPPNWASRILLTNCKPLLTTSATWILGVDVCGVNL